MKKLVTKFLSVIFIFLCCSTNTRALPCDGDFVEGEYLVRVNEQALLIEGNTKEERNLSRAGQLNALASYMRADEISHEYSLIPGLLHIRGMNFDETSAADLVARGYLEYVEPNCRIYLRDLPDDPRFAFQWGLHNTGQQSGTADMDIDAPEAWDVTEGSSNVVVGIVDSGIDYTHEDLVDNMWVNPNEIAGNGLDDDGNGYVDDVYGADINRDTGDPQDDYVGHGTHVAGIAGAVGNNATGVSGVNRTVKLMAIKIIHENSGTDADAIRGLEYAVAMKSAGAGLIALNNSWGSTGTPSQSLVTAVEAVNDAGMLFVAASGNDGFDNDAIPDSPSGIDTENVISVAAIIRDGNIAPFSNYGATTVDLAAPGVAILSTFPGDSYASMSGTSMAAPFVTGVAGLVASLEPAITPAQLKSRLMDTVTEVSGLSGLMVSPGIVNARSALSYETPVCSIPSGNAATRPAGDSDGDGVTDAQEATDGTNAGDPGSYKVTLESPVFAFWTGFLEITNILELVNIDSSTISVRISLYDINGDLGSQITGNIPALGQRDWIINDMAGYEEGVYGLLKIEYCGGNLDGRTSYYRDTTGVTSGVGDYDFVYSIPLSNPLYGDTAVSFNSFQPSENAAEAENLVANWLTVVNLASTSKDFTVRRYTLQGAALDPDEFTVSARGRRDREGGHVNPGTSNVGLHYIEPADDDAPYLAFITRYGYNAPPDEQPSAYDFAFPLNAKAGNGETLVVPLTTTVGAQNWLELINTTNAPTDVHVEFYRNDGTRILPEVPDLGSHAQEHVDVNRWLGDSQTGFARIVPDDPTSIIAQSMVYIRDSSTGSINAMYGSQAREALSSDLYGSYNLFLEMNNWLKLLNPTAADVNVTLTVNSSGGSNVSSVPVPARGSRDLNLRDSTTYGTDADTYGVVEINLSQPGDIMVELLRIRTDATTGGVDFAAPTEVR